MGQTSGSYLKSMKQSKIGSKDETIEQLGLIQQMLVAKTETVAKKLRDDAIEDKRFPVKAVVKTVGKQLIATGDKASVEEIRMYVREVCRSEFVDGLIKMAWRDVNELLQNTTGNEAERMASQLVISNSSVLRVDYHVYKFAFSSKGLRDKFECGICYVVQLGILNLEKANLDEVKEELAKCITNIEDFKFLRELILMGDLFREITRFQIDRGGGEENSANYAWDDIVRYFTDLSMFRNFTKWRALTRLSFQSV